MKMTIRKITAASIRRPTAKPPRDFNLLIMDLL
jgi:hypothetical protein